MVKEIPPLFIGGPTVAQTVMVKDRYMITTEGKNLKNNRQKRQKGQKRQKLQSTSFASTCSGRSVDSNELQPSIMAEDSG